ncbi:hypothetical protein Goari_014852, partial [Gossypium aridum]|nr:hypothetical protein [Gossypium aridum]
CERYGHVKELCSFLNRDKKEAGGNEGLKGAKSMAKSLVVDSAKCSPWMKGNENDRLDKEEVGVGNVSHESLIGFGSKSYRGSCWKGKIEVAAKAILVRVQLAFGQWLNLVKAIGNRLFTASIKTVTMEQGIEKNLNNCKERPINVGDFHLNATSHFNPTFKGLIELETSLNSNMLNPSKYTTVVFKDNLGDNTTTFLEGGDLGIFNIECSKTKMRASNGKGTATRKGREFKPNIMGLLETRVSGGKIDLIIANLDSVRVEVVYNHPQFVLIRIIDNSFRRPILLTFVYGSPNKQNRKFLWEGLNSMLPNDDVPWMTIGDFNAILSPSETRGGEEKGKCVMLLVTLLNQLIFMTSDLNVQRLL